MNRLAGGLSKSQLWFSFIIFMILGACLCFYMALKGFMPFSPQRMRIDAVTVIKPVYKDYNEGPLLLNISTKKYQKQTRLSRYIDSVFNFSAPVDNSIDKEIWSSPITEENNTANDKK